jgi:hypothetical protein
LSLTTTPLRNSSRGPVGCSKSGRFSSLILQYRLEKKPFICPLGHMSELII